jgi:non-ribosomal peptide synthetase component E (peptide arylation enzyme)
MPLFARDEGTKASMNAAAQYETEKILVELPDRISDVIKPFARQTPDHPALVQGNVTWSYGELAAVVADTALILKHYDIRPGDRVMIISEQPRARRADPRYRGARCLVGGREPASLSS